MKRLVALLLAALMAFTAAGCSKGGNEVANNEKLMKINFNDYEDSEDIPSWEGKKVNLSVWVDTSARVSYQSKRMPREDDVVIPEWERITGVHMDTKGSFDNGDGSFDSKLAQIIASNKFPGAATKLPNMSELAKNGLLYELSDLIKEYAPTVYKYYGPESEYGGGFWRQQMNALGGVYQINLGNTVANLGEFAKTFDEYKHLTQEQIDSCAGLGTASHAYFYVRDDILKKIYPEAHSAKELRSIYEKNGKFTESEIFDVPINDWNDTIEFLYKVRDTINASGEKETSAFYTHGGADNWELLTVFGSVYGYGPSGNYFSYYDREEQKCKFTFKETWFKDMLLTYNKLMRDGVASEEALVDTTAIFKEKLNKGQYAVIINDGNVPEDNSPDNKWCYRKVYLRDKINTTKFLQQKSYNEGNVGWSFFTKGLDKDELIQVIRSLEFAVSKPGDKLARWGTKSAGLYEEDENGNLHFKDDKLKRKVVDYENLPDVSDHGLLWPWPGRPFTAISMYDSRCFYNTLSTWDAAFNAAALEKLEVTPSERPWVFNTEYTSLIPEASRFWNARESFENAVTKCLAAKSDAEFESSYNAMVKLAEDKGLTDETLKEFDKVYKTQTNKDYMKYLEK